MPIHLSKALGVSKLSLKGKGVFDSMLDFDSRLHIDPALLKSCPVPEFRNADSKVVSYFKDILTLVSNARRGDKLWLAASKMLTFGEGLNSGLGYSSKGTRGSGIGPKMASNIVDTVGQMVHAGTNDPRIFELVPLFEEKVGPDRISDMISIILKEEFKAYTLRIANELGVDPLFDDRNQLIVFVPTSLLNDLPIASRWDDVPLAASYSEGVRTALNSVIGQSWSKVAKENKKSELKELLLDNPDLLRQLLANYKNRNARGYDFILDHIGLTIWEVLSTEAVLDNPLDLSNLGQITSSNIFSVVMDITTQFKKLIEDNGLWNHLYDNNLKLRPERFPQLLYYGIADSYCIANKLDLNREINGGSGALDFKVSLGLAKVNVELKYSSNPNLVEGYTKQLPVYNRAENVGDQYSIYLVIRVNDRMDHKINEIQGIINDRRKNRIYAPSLVVVDAQIKPTASKRK